MDMILNQNRMMGLLQSFYTLVQVRIGLWNLEGKEILGYPKRATEYCSLIKSSPKGLKACDECDKNAYQYTTKLHEPHIYQCHGGLTEMIVPIITADEIRVGYLMMGQMKQQEKQNPRSKKDVNRLLSSQNIDKDTLESAWNKLPIVRADQVRACANILQSLANYVWLDNYIRIQRGPLSRRVKSYIHENLDKELTLKGIAKTFRIGKTTLCSVVKSELNTTVNELIRSARIEKAQLLLQSNNLFISEIAEQVGISDYSYFAKVFKEEISVSPSVFRKLCENEYLP